MTRPRYMNDIKNEDRYYQIAVIYVSDISVTPSVLKHYNAMVEAVQKLEGKVKNSYGTVTLSLKKDREALEAQLKSDQARWDRYQESYKKVIGGDEIENYMRDGVKRWAKEEDLPDPFEPSSTETADSDA